MERVEHSTLLADRRDACRALKALSRKYRIEVGAKGMDALCQVLLQDRADAEIASYVLDTLKLIMNNEIYEEEGIVIITMYNNFNLFYKSCFGILAGLNKNEIDMLIRIIMLNIFYFTVIKLCLIILTHCVPIVYVHCLVG